MRRVRSRPLIFVVGLLVGLALGVGGTRWWTRGDRDSIATAQVFEHVLQEIRTNFVDSLTDEDLYARAARGVVGTLGDPYSTFLGPEEFRTYRDQLRGRGRTFGFTLESGLTGLRVALVVPGSPADRAGLEPGDFVVDIGGRPSRGWSAAQALAALRVDSLGGVSVRIQSPSDSVPVETRLEPGPARLPAIGRVVRLTDSVGYLSLRTVSDRASEEVRGALAELRAWELGALVIDLRGNLGGRLEEALAVADIFLGPGRRIGSVAKRRLEWGYAAAHPEVYPKLALTLLVDGKTASSAEIIAAALRDNDRARLVGERTYGKGLIQTTIPLGDSMAVRLTTGRWQGPGGELINGGILPDSVVTPAPWTASLGRSLAARTDALGEVLLALAARRVADSVPADSVVLDRADHDQIRARLRQAGLSLSRRTMALHDDLFRHEVARLVAASTGDFAAAARFALLSDPVVAAGLAVQARVQPQGPSQ